MLGQRQDKDHDAHDYWNVRNRLQNLHGEPHRHRLNPAPTGRHSGRALRNFGVRGLSLFTAPTTLLPRRSLRTILRSVFPLSYGAALTNELCAVCI